MSDDVKALSTRIGEAIRRVTSGAGVMRIPVDPTDPDVVLADCLAHIDGEAARTDLRVRAVVEALLTATPLADELERSRNEKAALADERDYWMRAHAQDAARLEAELREAVRALRRAAQFVDEDTCRHDSEKTTVLKRIGAALAKYPEGA
jgi:hypothetical protein